MQGKAEDAGGLTPAKDDNAAMRTLYPRAFARNSDDCYRDLLRQGREEGIKVLVVTLKNLSQPLDLVIQTVAEQFGLSLEEAEGKTKQYWEQ